MKNCLFIIFLLNFVIVFSQQEITKSTFLEPLNNGWSSTNKYISARVGGGLQKNFYTELGVSFQESTSGCAGFFSQDLYTALEWNPSKNKNIYGLKLGYEANAFFLNLGIEAKYLTNFTKNDFIITPKIGLGIFGDINLFYGYNFSINSYPFQEIGKHQVSVVFNFHKYFLTY